MMDSASQALLARGYAARKEHRPLDAKQLFEEAVELCRKSNDQGGRAQALAGLGQIERDLREGDAARRHYEESVAIYRTLDSPLKLAHTVRHLADILREQGELVLAEPRYQEALQIYREHEEAAPLDLANTFRGFALLKGDRGATRDALSLWREAGDLYAQCNVAAGVAESKRQLEHLSHA
jgi:tetratricopeptide (TPR) repeat protein